MERKDSKVAFNSGQPPSIAYPPSIVPPPAYPPSIVPLLLPLIRLLSFPPPLLILLLPKHPVNRNNPLPLLIPLPSFLLLLSILLLSHILLLSQYPPSIKAPCEQPPVYQPSIVYPPGYQPPIVPPPAYQPSIVYPPGYVPARIDIKSLYEQGQLPSVTNSATGVTYNLTRFLGQGSFGTVFEANIVGEPEKYALKLMQLGTDSDREDFLLETTAFKDLSYAPKCNSYIVCMRDSFEYAGPYGRILGVMVSELMEGDLWKSKPSDDEVPLMIKELLEGLYYIHQNGFAHRDLKPGNVLRSGKVFKIADLGLACSEGIIPIEEATKLPPSAKIANESVKQNIPACRYFGTPAYVSPTSMKDWGHVESLADAQKEDVWGMGLVLYESIFGHYPFDTTGITQEQLGEALKNLTQADLDRAFTINTKYPRSEPGIVNGQDIIELLSHMLRVDPKERWTSKQLLEFYNSKLKMTPESTSWLSGLLSPRSTQRKNGQQQTVRSSDILKEFENVAESFADDDQAGVDAHMKHAQQLIASGPYDIQYLKDKRDLYERDLASMQKEYNNEMAERKAKFDQAVLDMLKQITV